MTTTENQKLQSEPTARYVLTIDASTGYQATTEGECTPERYATAIAALHGTIPDDTKLLKAAPRLLSVLQRIEQWDAEGIALTEDLMSSARSAIVEATGAHAACHAPKSTWQFSQSEIAVGVRYWLALQDGSVVHGYYESHSFWTNVGVIQSEQVAAYSDFVVPSHPASEVRDV